MLNPPASSSGCFIATSLPVALSRRQSTPHTTTPPEEFANPEIAFDRFLLSSGANFFASPPGSFPGGLGGGLGGLFSPGGSDNTGTGGNSGTSLPDGLGIGSDDSAAGSSMDFGYLFGNEYDEEDKLDVDNYPDLGDDYADLVDGVLGDLLGSDTALGAVI